MIIVKVSDFGKDHWSLLAHIETLCVDARVKGVGEIDKRRVRCNMSRHPLLNVNGFKWNPDWGTRLANYWKKDGSTNYRRIIPKHDDWDCLDDLEAAKLVEILSIINGFVKMTEKGLRVSAELRAFKATGGVFADFRWADPQEVKA